jgi:hypothetical protein
MARRPGEYDGVNRHRANYSLRSLFFYQKLQEAGFEALFQQIKDLDCPDQIEDVRCRELGISIEAIHALQQRNIPLCYVFALPEVLISSPALIRYYRGAAALSQKGLQRLTGINVETYESRRARQPLTLERATVLAAELNRFISAAVISILEFSLNILQQQVIMAAGEQTGGSWRNEVGRVAVNIVKGLLLRDLMLHGMLSSGFSADLSDLTRRTEFDLVTGWKIRFSYDPDIALISPGGITEVVIEVKGGLDEAGALERYGSAKKSFDAALSRNPRCTTVYLASVLTPAVQARIQEDRAVREVWDLALVLASEEERERFLNQFYWWMHLQRVKLQ